MGVLLLLTLLLIGCGEDAETNTSTQQKTASETKTTGQARTEAGTPQEQIDESRKTYHETRKASQPFPSEIVFSGNVGRDGPFRTMILRQQLSPSNWHYALEIKDSLGAIVQTLTIRNGIAIGKNDVQVVDLNADGFKDIMLVGGEDHAGTKWYKTWIYDSQQQKYLWIAKAFGKD